jgi:hypothetical protein
MDRQVISQEELKSSLTAELQKFEGCENCQVVAVMRLHEPDKTGCNWSRTVTVRATGVPRDIFVPAVKEVITRARDKFNLE